ncbi:unnamed protein product [Acanthoscelides obtectus]|uniref:Gustatory receptor n=1 Tax=Acanthoscelides obtectus TaxID=200917 RepID=A0A9P0PJM5_ACAOB|nr:unnamed protein product [Acanthoscelides obtectus]CAK1620356.1 hypothetical protein AOBTE_LOCUS332 [Acanthoscelides obtectus]
MLTVTTYVVYVIVNCEMTIAEGRTVLTTCYILEDKFPIKSPVRQELLELIDQVHYHAPVFTAFDLFELNRRTFLVLISVLTTYFIVSIQFIMVNAS